MKIPEKPLHILAWILLSPVVLLSALWCVGAAYYTFPWSGVWRSVGSCVYAAVLFGTLAAGFRRRVLFLIPAAVGAATFLFYAHLTPEIRFHSVEWQTPWARQPKVEFHADGTVTVSDMRNFRYRTPEVYEVAYTRMSFDPKTVAATDLAVSHWDGLQAVAHTMLSFAFDDGRHLAVSMETRLPKGAEQGFLPGLFKQYEVMMLLAPEEDLFRLRTDYRQEELYLYRTNATREQSLMLLTAVLHAADRLLTRPRFYNSITTNCTTSLAPLLHWINPAFNGDIRLLANGYSDRLLYDLGYLACRDGESFEDLKRRSLARPVPQAPPEEYSAALRAQNP